MSNNTKYEEFAHLKSNLKNVVGSFSIEGITLNDATRKNIERIGSGQASYQQIVDELRAKYAKEK